MVIKTNVMLKSNSRPKLKGVMYVYLLGLAVTNLCVLVSYIQDILFVFNLDNLTHHEFWKSHTD